MEPCLARRPPSAWSKAPSLVRRNRWHELPRQTVPGDERAPKAHESGGWSGGLPAGRGWSPGPQRSRCCSGTWPRPSLPRPRYGGERGRERSCCWAGAHTSPTRIALSLEYRPPTPRGLGPHPSRSPQLPVGPGRQRLPQFRLELARQTRARAPWPLCSDPDPPTPNSSPGRHHVRSFLDPLRPPSGLPLLIRREQVPDLLS
jgi:hypothetical protein